MTPEQVAQQRVAKKLADQERDIQQKISERKCTVAISADHPDVPHTHCSNNGCKRYVPFGPIAQSALKAWAFFDGPLVCQYCLLAHNAQKKREAEDKRFHVAPQQPFQQPFQQPVQQPFQQPVQRPVIPNPQSNTSKTVYDLLGPKQYQNS